MLARLRRQSGEAPAEHVPQGRKEERKDEPKEEKEPRSRLRLVLWSTLAVLLVGFAILLRYTYVAPSPGRELALDEVYDLATANQLHTVTLLDEQAMIVGRKCLAPPVEPPPENGRPRRCYDLTDRFHTPYPSSQVSTQELINIIRNSGADLSVDRQTRVAVARFVSSFVFPLLMLANLLALILGRGGDRGVGDIAGFSRLGKKGKEAGGKKAMTFADVAGADEAVTELREVIDYLTDPARFQAYGAAPPKGVMLFGPPGCGKTLLARATAGESGVPFFSVAGTEFVESLVGVGAARVRDLFRQVREVAPAIVFIDEIDAVGRRRSGEGSSGGEREQTLNQLLVELDGFEVTSGVVLMGASNRPDILDPALLRPGRFDRHITMEPPDVAGRQAILQLHAHNRPIGPDVDLETVARRTPGFTGADLANVMNEGALLAIRRGPDTPISATILSEAIQRVLHGPQRRGKILSPEEKRRLAVHEASHAIVATACGYGADVHRVSILARGKALAQASVEGGDRSLLTKSELAEQLAMAVAGMAGEVLVMGESSTTAADDVAKATFLAREMVGIYGMSDQLGRVRLLSRSDNGFLGTDELSLDLVSGQTMAHFDTEVQQLIAAAEIRAIEILKGARDHVDALVEALLHRESLEGPDLEALVDPVRLVAPPPANGQSQPAQRKAAPRRDTTRAGEKT